MECILGGTDLSPPIETLDLGGGGRGSSQATTFWANGKHNMVTFCFV